MALRKRLPEAEIHLMDDVWLAVESAKLNLGKGNSVFHWTDTLKGFGDGMFDMVVSNPPFHFEYEIDITVPLGLFRDVKRTLKSSGVFLLVANRHLNYRTHLNRSFSLVNVVASDDKFEILRCYR
jgi:16S rRNA G1207 methylase RsmC